MPDGSASSPDTYTTHLRRLERRVERQLASLFRLEARTPTAEELLADAGVREVWICSTKAKGIDVAIVRSSARVMLFGVGGPDDESTRRAALIAATMILADRAGLDPESAGAKAVATRVEGRFGLPLRPRGKEHAWWRRCYAASAEQERLVLEDERRRAAARSAA